MSAVLGKCLPNAPNIQLLEEEQAARSIVVSNISPQTTKENVTIHFQRQKNGGGEIDAVHIPKEGTAVITFEESEVVETVLGHSHTLEGSTLKLERLIADDSPEVFQLVKARVNFDRFQLSSQEWGKALEALKHKAEVQCPHIPNKECVLSGTFNQVLTAQTFLQDILHRRSSVLQQSMGGNDASHQSDTTQTQQSSSAAWDIDVTDNFDNEGLNSFEVQPQFMKLIKRVYERKLRYMEETYGLNIVWDENASHVQMRPSKASSNPCSYQEGCDAFIDLYQSVFPNMGREEVEIENVDNEVIEAINSVEAENNVVIEMAENKIVVYAEKNEILSSLQVLRGKLGLQQGVSRRTRRTRHRTTTPSALQHNETRQDNQFSAFPAQSLKQILSNRVSLSLYQSDITDESVDAIVNAANEGLMHAGGVAAAIVLKGGRQIEEESRQIMLQRNKRPLNVGDAVYTKGGNLFCRYVIHTVGPRWNDHSRQRSISLLKRACMESLCLAAELKLSSIALPAISSGIFGMPKSLCAQVMFKAIEEFSSSTDGKFSTLCDVRIVIIDDQTISVFREEFVKRYAFQEAPSTHLPHSEHHPRSPNQEENVSSALRHPGKARSFSPLKDSSEEQSKESGEDNANVESPNEGADPNVESDKPSEHMPDSLKRVHSSNNGSTSNASKDNPPKGSENTNVKTDLHSTRKEKDLGGSPSASNKGDENSDNVESSNEGVGSNVDNNEHLKEIPAGIKEESSNSNNPPNEGKDNPLNSNEKSLSEKNLKPSNMATVVRPEEQSKESGEDNANVESPNEGADPNVESDKPSEHMPDSFKEVHSPNNGNTSNAGKDNSPKGNENTNVETDLHSTRKEKDLGGSPSASNKSDENSDNVESSNEGVGSNVDNNEHLKEIPAGIKEESSNRNNPPNESKDNPPNSNEKSLSEKNLKPSNMATVVRQEEQSKKSGEDNANVESPNEGADPNVESDKPSEHMPDSFKEVHSPNNGNTSNAGKDNSPKGNENTNVETDLHSTRKEKDLGGSPSASNKSDEDSDNVESSNKGVGPNVDNNEHLEEIPAGIKEGSSNSNDLPNESKDNPLNSNEKSPFEKNLKPSNMATVVRPSSGRGRGILAPNFYGKLRQDASGSESNENTALATTRETKAAYFGKGRAITFATSTPPPGLSVTEEGKRFARDIGNGVKGDQNTDTADSVRGKEELETKESINESFEEGSQELKDNHQNADNDKSICVPGSRLPHKDGITDMEETKKDTIEETTTDDERRLPRNENTNNLAAPKPDNIEVQAGYSSSNATCDDTSYPKEPLPLNHPGTSPASENLTPTASHEIVSVQDVVEERRSTVSNTGSEKLYEMQKTHSTGEPKCSMCMNLNKDPVYPAKCGHHFCKSCTKHFVEKTMICPVCKQENQFRGNQPPGYMTRRTESWNSLSGYEEFGTIVLTFNFDKGIQGSDHPNPGEPYSGLFCSSYLPDNPAGREVCNLLRSAFINARLIFTIGNCPATGEKNKIVSNGIELKWNRSGGPANYGYPDPSYLDRVKSQLAEKGITQPLN